MSVDYTRFGTRISLSDRFALIRKEAAKRAIVVNPTIDSPAQQLPRDNFNKVMKNFNAINRADRPSAALQQGSEKNKRLVYQMALAPSVLAEINQSYEPQIRTQLPTKLMMHSAATPQSIYRPPPLSVGATNLTPVPSQQKRIMNIRQRLGPGAQNGVHASSNSNVKSRLGIKRKPIDQRLSLPLKSPSNGVWFYYTDLTVLIITLNYFFLYLGIANNRMGRNLNNGNQLRPKNTVAFKRKSLPAKLTPGKGIRNLRGSKPPLNGRKSTPTQKPVTAEQLDDDLDVYMRKTKGYLNADLDAYMSQA